MSPEHWRWQFPKNPFSRPIVWVAAAPDGRLVGHYSLIPVPFVRRGQSSLAALSILSMIHPDFQKRGILKALAAAAERQLDEDRVEVGITFLNDNSLHAYTHHFGWTELGGPNFIFFTVLDGAAPLRKIVRVDLLARGLARLTNPVFRLFFAGRDPAPDPSIRRVERVDERADALWRRFSAGIENAVERTARYLNWRVGENPAGFRIFIAESGGELTGLVVTKTARKFGMFFGYVAELLFDPSREEAGDALVRHALADLRAQGCAMATAVTAGSEPVRRALGRAGFWRLPRKAMPHGIHFCFKHRGGGENHQGDGAGKWLLSWIDHDVV